MLPTPSQRPRTAVRAAPEHRLPLAVTAARAAEVLIGSIAKAAGLAYNVSKATVTGNTAIVTVSLSGAAAAIGSASEALTYAAGRWGFVPSDLSSYGHGSVKADIAAAKAAGYCARS